MILALIFALSTAASDLSDKKQLFTYACAGGVVEAADVLNLASGDLRRKRGELRCIGAAKRLWDSGQISNEPDLVEFACGAGVGALFALAGLESEVRPNMSKRATSAGMSCVTEVRRVLAERRTDGGTK